MDAELPKAFAALAALGAPILHYKVCSTFDSSPSVGSIGRAIDIGVPHMPGRWSPMHRRRAATQALPGLRQPLCRRRRRRPSTGPAPDDVASPGDADARGRPAPPPGRADPAPDRTHRHGAAAARCGGGHASANSQSDAVPVVMIDVLDDETLRLAGQLVWQQRGRGLFSASSSGLQYALAAHWRDSGLLPQQPSLPKAAAAGPHCGCQRQLFAGHRRANCMGARQRFRNRTAASVQRAGQGLARRRDRTCGVQRGGRTACWPERAGVQRRGPRGRQRAGLRCHRPLRQANQGRMPLARSAPRWPR